MGDMHGSLRDCSIEGIPFTVRGDVGVDLQVSRYKVETIANGSGDDSVKVTNQERYAENITLGVNMTELDLLRGWCEDLSKLYKVNLTYADKSKAKAPCILSMGTYNNQNGQVTIRANAPGGWTLIAGS